MRATKAAIAVFVCASCVGAAEPDVKEVRKAVERALPLLLKGAQGHTKKRTCFACHNQALPLLAFKTAGAHGFPVRTDDVHQQTKFIASFLDKNADNFRKGKGTGGQADSAGYALLALAAGGWKPDATTEAVVEYLLQRDAELGRWKTVSKRPPSEASEFTVNYLALHGVRSYGSAAQKERIDARIKSALAWLLKTKPQDTEDRVFRLRALKEAGADAKALRTAADELKTTQRKDGGWSQLDNLESDAYATGSALVALHEAGGLPVSDPVYQRGVAFLLKTQLPDGSWLVKSRSRPFQTYYESGFPHEKNQFISIAASGWAAAALALSLPETTRQSRR